LVVGLVGGVCQSSDWRGDLPRFFGEFLPQARVVFLSARRKEMGKWRCAECRPDRMTYSSDCHDDCRCYLGSGSGQVAADLLLVIGAGSGHSIHPATKEDINYAELQVIFQSGLVDRNTHTVHFPIRKSQKLSQMFPFNRVVHDDDFPKPMSPAAVAAMEKHCTGVTKRREFVYVGRYVPSKGQRQFLELVDPQLLAGYHVNFFGAGFDGSEYPQQLVQLAQARNISITVHPPVDSHGLRSHYCRSMGQIHYAYSDDNPRAPYEGMYAHNPLFVTYESALHKIMYEQQFVVAVNAWDVEGFNPAFQQFMNLVQHRSVLQPLVDEFAHNHLSSQGVFRHLCIDVGVCQATEQAQPVSQRLPFTEGSTSQLLGEI